MLVFNLNCFHYMYVAAPSGHSSPGSVWCVAAIHVVHYRPKPTDWRTWNGAKSICRWHASQYSSYHPSDVGAFTSSLVNLRFSELANWMRSYRLHLIFSMTDVIWVCNRPASTPSTCSMHCRSMTSWSTRWRLFATLVSTSTPTHVQRAVLWVFCRASAIAADLQTGTASQQPSRSRHWWSFAFCRDWIMAMAWWLACLPISCADSSRSRAFLSWYVPTAKILPESIRKTPGTHIQRG